MNVEDEVEGWILSEGHRAFEVTAVHPDTGKSKKLEPEELRDILALLIEVERVLRGKARKPAGGFSQKFRDFGLAPAWYEEAAECRGPLFIARHRGVEQTGKSFKEFMAVFQEAGRRSLGLAGQGGKTD